MLAQQVDGALHLCKLVRLAAALSSQDVGSIPIVLEGHTLIVIQQPP